VGNLILHLVWAIFAARDLIGLVVCMVALMFLFRWDRRFRALKC
jgi:hypothetical protein